MKQLRAALYALGAAVSATYLASPDAGPFELAADDLRWVGNLDEIGAVGLLALCVRGLWVLFGRARRPVSERRA